jgi:hypothetical protein
MSVMIIQVKKNDDLLEGISKLDYLVKVSIFQRHKGGPRVDTLAISDSDDEESFEPGTFRDSEGFLRSSIDICPQEYKDSI